MSKGTINNRARIVVPYPTLSEVAVKLNVTRADVMRACKLRNVACRDGRMRKQDVGTVYFGLCALLPERTKREPLVRLVEVL
jgi:hypothetical protein